VLRHQDRAFFFKLGIDERFAKFSPGVQLTLDLTRHLCADPAIATADSTASADHPMINPIWRGRFAIGDARRNWRFHWLGRCGLSLGFADGWGSLARGIRCSSFRGATRGHLVAFPLIRSGYDQANCGFCNSWRIGLAKLRQNRVILRSSADVSSYLRDDTRHSRRTIRGRAGSNPVVRCVRYICGAS